MEFSLHNASYGDVDVPPILHSQYRQLTAVTIGSINTANMIALKTHRPIASGITSFGHATVRIGLVDDTHMAFGMSHDVFDTLTVTLVVPSRGAKEYVGAWELGTSYDEGNVVDHDNLFWRSRIDNNLGSEPSVTSIHWDLATASISQSNEGIKQVVEIPDSFDEYVLHLTHNHIERSSTADNLVVTVGHASNFFGYSTGRAVPQQAGSIDDATRAPLDAIGGYTGTHAADDVSVITFEFIASRNEGWITAIEHVTIDGTDYDLGAAQRFSGGFWRRTITGTPEITLPADDQIALNFKDADDNVWLTDATAVAYFAGLYGWRGTTYGPLDDYPRPRRQRRLKQ